MDSDILSIFCGIFLKFPNFDDNKIGDNNPVPIHLWQSKVILKREKVYKYFVHDCITIERSVNLFFPRIYSLYTFCKRSYLSLYFLKTAKYHNYLLFLDGCKDSLILP